GVSWPVVAAAPEPWLRRRKLERGSAEELQVLGPAVSVGKAPDHDEGGARMGLEELGHREGARGAGEAGDAQVDSSLGKGFCQRFECRPLSQHLREHTTVSRPLRRAGGWGGGFGWGGGAPRSRRPRGAPRAGAGPSARGS